MFEAGVTNRRFGLKNSRSFRLDGTECVLSISPATVGLGVKSNRESISKDSVLLCGSVAIGLPVIAHAGRQP